MTGTALVLTYHAVENGPAPLCIEPSVFSAHLDCLLESGVRAVTVAELGRRLREGELRERTVALTFDDGAASAVRIAAPRLRERGVTATFFCVAGHLGGQTDWPTQPARVPRLDLAAAEELAELAQAGFEIGSHGVAHEPLHRASREEAQREVVDSRRALEQAIGAEVTSFACPYAARPSPTARALIRETYDAACDGSSSTVGAATDPLALPRVDAHYLRRPELFRRALAGSLDRYLSVRSAGARARRVLMKDYAGAGNR